MIFYANLHELSYPIFGKNEECIITMSPADFEMEHHLQIIA